MNNAIDEIEVDYINEQAYFDSLSTIPLPTGDKVSRFFKGHDCPDPTTYDIVYIDRLTGKEVLRYDGADPANTKFNYGATPDADLLKRKGLDIKEMIDPNQAVITLEQCYGHMRVDYTDYDY